MFKNYFLETVTQVKKLCQLYYLKKRSLELAFSNIFEHDFCALTFIVVNYLPNFYYQGSIFSDISYFTKCVSVFVFKYCVMS